MERFALNLLGRFEVFLGPAAATALRGKKARALVAYLAMEPGRIHARDTLAGLLWGGRADSQARKSLRQTVYEIRRATSGAHTPLLTVQRAGVGLRAGVVDVDVARFIARVDDGTRDALEEAAALYRGDLLEGFPVDEAAFEEWLAAERARLRERAISALTMLLAHQMDARATEPAIQTAIRLLALDPLQETVHRRLMQLYVRQGRRSAALRQYVTCVAILRRELRTPPEAETTRLYHEILEQQRHTVEPSTPRLPSLEEASRSAPDIPVLVAPDRPSVAVLPFTNVGRDAAQTALADGITVEIIATLSKLSGLFVIASNSVFTYKGRAVKIQDVGRELGVRHVLEGTVRRTGNRVRVTAQLIDANTGFHRWAERFERRTTDLFTLQDEIAQRIVIELDVSLTEGEQARRRRRSTSNVDALEHWAKGLAAYRTHSPENNLRARAEFERAAAVDPTFAVAKVLLGWTYFSEVINAYAANARSTATAEALAREALARDPDLPDAHTLLAGVHLLRGRDREALVAARRGIELDPNAADLHAFLANVLMRAERFDEALAHVGKAMRLSPAYPAWYLLVAAVAYRGSGRVTESRAAYAAAKAAMPDSAVARIGLILCDMMVGRVAEARAELEAWRVRDPDVSLARVRRMVSFGFSPARQTAVLDLMCRAGLT